MSVLAAVFGVLPAGVAAASTWTWNNTTASWGTAADWSPATVPSSNSSTVLIFGGTGSSAYTSTASNIIFGTVEFDSTASVTEILTGNTASNSGVNQEIQQDGSGAFSWNNQINIGATLVLNGTGTGAVTLSGNYGDNGGTRTSVTVNGAATFYLTGNSNYSGTVTVSSGVLNSSTLVNIGSNGGLGDGINTNNTTNAASALSHF